MTMSPSSALAAWSLLLQNWIKAANIRTFCLYMSMLARTRVTTHLLMRKSDSTCSACRCLGRRRTISQPKKPMRTDSNASWSGESVSQWLLATLLQENALEAFSCLSEKLPFNCGTPGLPLSDCWALEQPALPKTFSTRGRTFDRGGLV